MGIAQRVLLIAALACVVSASAWLGDGRREAATSSEILLAAGDIASCSSTGDEDTADVLAGLTGTVVTLGDNVYPDGTTAEFNGCYHPSWGDEKSRTWPSAGNHDYHTAGAAGYYGYFGAAAGDPSKGYYSFDLGAWHIIAINSNCAAVGGCAAGSLQEQWLRQDLATTPSQCTLAYWHHPRFSSGSTHGNNAAMQPIWQALYDWGAEIVLSGHEHNYERFGPQTPAGVGDANGIVEFVVGTGGRSHYPFGTPKPNSLMRHTGTFGVLKLTLDDGSYDFDFVPVTGGTFDDSGSDVACISNDEDGDTVVDESDNCPVIANTPQIDTDADAAGDACDVDDDSDGCADVEEAGGSPAAGGDRDSLVHWDFFDAPAPAGPDTGADGRPVLTALSSKNQAVSLQDVGVVLSYVGRTSSNPAYSADNNADGTIDGVQLDRTPSADEAKPWRSGAPNNAVSLQDVGVALAQVGHSCVAAP